MPADAAPKHWIVICVLLEVREGRTGEYLTVGMVRPAYEYIKIRQLFWFVEIRLTQAAMKSYGPGYIGVKVYSEV